jgi:DeoR/GlpR family transcriptional regulator of sugar metabolism
MTNRQRVALVERFIREHHYASLRTLADRFDSSVSTVRRALDLLVKRGVVHRHHGGASLAETDVRAQEFDFAARDRQNPDEKLAIGRLVADQIRPGMTVILDGGSTTYAVARHLVDKPLRIVTNSLPVASLFSSVDGTETTVTGGSLYRKLGTLVGPLCEESLAQVHADVAIVGGAGVTEQGVWSHTAQIASAQRKMIAAAGRTLFVLDRSKFGRTALNLITPFEKSFTIVTDTRPAPAVARAIEQAGAQLTLARKRRA